MKNKKEGFLMKNICPIYADKFSCIAGTCPDTCCAGWAIVVDEKFQNIYKSSSASFSGLP